MHRDLTVCALTAVFVLLLSPLSLHAQEQDQARLEWHAWAVDTNWAEQLGWVERQLEACRGVGDAYAAKPCDGFIAEALDRIYGVADFRRGGDYLGMASVMYNIRQGQNGWTSLGTGETQEVLDKAQAAANAGDPVLAALSTDRGGHVSVILPGNNLPSSSWNRNVPNSASLFISNSKRSYIGKRLSFSFGGESAEAVTFYTRSRTETAGPEPESSAELAAIAPAAGAEAAEAPASAEPAPDSAPDAATSNGDAEATAKSILEAKLETALAPPTESESPYFADALTAANTATEADQAESASAIYGMWCERAGLAQSQTVKAVFINGQGRTLTWGRFDTAGAQDFEGQAAQAILGIEQSGSIVSISFAETGEAIPQATAFFVIDEDGRLFESHVFDHASNEILAKDTILERCP